MMHVRAMKSACWAAAMLQAAVAVGADAKAVSLEDCLRMGLQKNLDIQLAQYGPLLTKLSLSSALWTYEPTMNMGASQAFRASAGFAGIGQFNPPPNESWIEQYTAGFGGAVPTGLSYNIVSGVNRNSGAINGRSQEFVYTPFASINLTQPLLRNFWIDQPRLTIQLEKRNLKQGELDVRNQMIGTLTDVTLAYHDLIAARETVKVQQKALQLAERQLAENKKRVEVGNMAPLDEKEAAAQVARSRADLISAQQQLLLAENGLKRLITDDFAAQKDLSYEPTAQLVAVPESFNRMDSWHKGLTTRPDIQRTRLELEKQRITMRFTRNQLFPQLDLTGSYGLTGQDRMLSPSLGNIADQQYPNHSAGIRLSVPFSNRRARNEHQAAKLRNEQTLLRFKQLEQSVMVEIDNAIRTADAALQRVEATEAFREYSEAALQAEEKKLENGKSTSFVVLQRQRDFTAAQSDAIRAKSDYNKALARLAQAEGNTLERYRIQVEVK
jgi:outer membrane protein TolC